ncbi:2777_t:CDS:2 [Ambispora leptoticha]|uniref:2777_t:CDS:1 n=1 Tax=Ambispora leptoticha TaxID=144679 RepID=A0A9N8ZNJ6_9GLOM|nr:2777_t:CDS:2 [Ambispora leptoticha]
MPANNNAVANTASKFRIFVQIKTSSALTYFQAPGPIFIWDPINMRFFKGVRTKMPPSLKLLRYNRPNWHN